MCCVVRVSEWHIEYLISLRSVRTKALKRFRIGDTAGMTYM